MDEGLGGGVFSTFIAIANMLPLTGRCRLDTRTTTSLRVGTVVRNM